MQLLPMASCPDGLISAWDAGRGGGWVADVTNESDARGLTYCRIVCIVISV